MKLFDFLLRHTGVLELCAIRYKGYVIDLVWVDYEDLFASSFCKNEELAKSEVIEDSWGTIPIVDKENVKQNIPCHFIDVELS